MPKKLLGPKGKYGDPKEFHIPVQLYGPRGNIAFSEWVLKNPWRESLPFFFDRSGRRGNQSGLILDRSGKPANLNANPGKPLPGELKKLAGAAKERQGGKEIKWTPSKLRAAGQVLKKIMALGHGDEQKAMQLLFADPFFREGVLLDRVTFPDAKFLKIGDIIDAAVDYFLSVQQKAQAARKSEFENTDRKLGIAEKKVIPAAKYQRARP